MVKWRLHCPCLGLVFSSNTGLEANGTEVSIGATCNYRICSQLYLLPFFVSKGFLYRLVFLIFISFSTFLLQDTQVSHLSQLGSGRGEELPLKPHFRCYTKRRGGVTTVFKCGGGFSRTGTPTRGEVMLVVSWPMNIYTHFIYLWLVYADCSISLPDNLPGIS